MLVLPFTALLYSIFELNQLLITELLRLRFNLKLSKQCFNLVILGLRADKSQLNFSHLTDFKSMTLIIKMIIWARNAYCRSTGTVVSAWLHLGRPHLQDLDLFPKLFDDLVADICGHFILWAQHCCNCAVINSVSSDKFLSFVPFILW